jgi:predicted dinucleotide-binding enzyme
MNIVVIGRGNAGGGLPAPWRKTGHQVTALGRGGGNASGATDAWPSRNEAFESLAEEIKSITRRRI